MTHLVLAGGKFRVSSCSTAQPTQDAVTLESALALPVFDEIEDHLISKGRCLLFHEREKRVSPDPEREGMRACGTRDLAHAPAHSARAYPRA